MANSTSTVSLHSHIIAVIVFNGLNFSEWLEQVNFHLGVLDLDLAVLEEKSANVIDRNNDAERLKHKAWDSVTAKKYRKLVEEHFRSADKSVAGILMVELTTVKYDGLRRFLYNPEHKPKQKSFCSWGTE
ncbi:hypothetical protein BUALT_Bualt02G0053100 [Buddleja alternifolia]|uniref:UBN2_3 domain-containing protein n=1 Tax=Buddleja alternifolia TaxID=168488 RepID=A0AAV6Y8A7_9LAMI|nr:hypothetical protein BUALT_Bualt02G0053100 [Buddleja alternifolia]